MNQYATLDEMRAFKSISSTSTDDDTELLRYLTWASRQIDIFCKRRKFHPTIATYSFDYQRSSQNHWLDRDLLELTTLSVDGTSISSANYQLYPINNYPKYRVALKLNQSNVFTYSSTPQAAVSMAGVWGWHDDWDNAWLDTGDTVQDAGGINASVASLTFTDIDGTCVDGFSRRCSAGHLLKINSEYLAVTATNTTTNVATIRRGVNGSTAAVHDNGDTIYVYRTPAVANMATLALAKWCYEMRSQYGGVIALPSFEGTPIEIEVKRIFGQFELPIRRAGFVSQTWL